MSIVLVLAATLSASASALQAPSPRRAASPQPTAPPVVEGTVKGPDGKAVENALVVAWPVSRGMDEPPLSARSDAEGRFRLALKNSGALSVQVQASGLAAWKGEKVMPGTPLAVALEKGLAVEGVVRDGNSGTPVASARVAATVGLSLAWEPETGVVSVLTDARGRYRLQGLARGLYEISARAPGYGRVQRQNVRAGATADFHLFPGASLYGLVQGPDGKPAAQAIVLAERDERGGGPPPERTDATGRFELIGIPPGSYTLIARHPDFAPGLTTGVLIERGVDAGADVTLTRGAAIAGRLLGTDDSPVAGRVVVKELNGRPVGAALAEVLRAEAAADGRFMLERLPPGFHALGALAPGYAPTRIDVDVGARAAAVEVGDVLLETGLSIRGRVSDRAGSLVADVRIMGYVRQPRAGGGPAEARSGPDGRFVLAGLSQASYLLSASANGYGEARRTVQAGDEGVEFVLDPAGAITGLVVDEAGRPVDSYDISAEPMQEDQNSGGRSVVSADGRFRLEDVAHGTYVLQVTAPDRAPATRSDVVVPAGGAVDVGRIRLARGGVVRGAVADSQGAPVAWATVSVRRAGRDYSGGSSPESVSDPSGAFEVRGVAEGTSIAVARHPEYAEGQSAPFEVDPGRSAAEARIVLSLGGRIEGSARKRDGSPVGPAFARVSPLGAPWRGEPASLRPDGTFTIEHVPAGRVRVFLMQGSGGRYSGQGRDTEIRDGETSVVEFVQRDILVTGQLRRSGAPAPGMRVTLRGRGAFSYYGGPAQASAAASSGPQRLTALTRDDGGFELLADEPGRVTVIVESADGRLTLPSRVVEIPDADSFTLDLDYSGATISGLVADKETGQPVAEATVHAQSRTPDAGGPARAVSGSDGRFQLELQEGEYRLNASAEGYAAVGKGIKVPGSGDVLLALSRGAVLKGKVLDMAGRGIPGLDVSTSSGDPADWSGQSWAYTRPDGSFQFEALLRRPYNVFAGTSAVGFGLAAGVVPGEATVTLTLRPPGRVQLLVRGADGAPVAGAYGDVVQFDGVKIMSTIDQPSTDAQGIAELVLPAGRIQLDVWKDKAEGSVTLDLPEGGSASAEVTLAAVPPGGAP